MVGYSLKAWAVSLGMLAGTWGVVVLALGNLLPQPDANQGRLTAVSRPQHRSSRTYPLQIVKKLPCTNEHLTLDLSLMLDATWRTDLDGEWVDFVIQATLTALPSERAPTEIAPAHAHFGFSSPRYGTTGHVHELHAPLLGQPPGTELVVGIEQGMDGAGHLIVQPGRVRLNCG